MATWPDIEKPSGLSQKPVKKQIRSDFSAGYVQSRPLWTRMRKQFELSWSTMKSSDLSTLESFFESNQGGSFTWTHPETGASYTCLFSDDSIDANFLKGSLDRYKVTVNIEEQ